MAGLGRACQKQDREFDEKRRWLGKERTLGGMWMWCGCDDEMNPTCIHFNRNWRSTLSARQVPSPRACSCLAYPSRPGPFQARMRPVASGRNRASDAIPLPSTSVRSVCSMQITQTGASA